MLSDIDIKILYMLQAFKYLIAQTYRGGIEILESNNPEKIVYSAHSMRELIHMLIELDKVIAFGRRIKSKKKKKHSELFNMNIEGIRKNLNPKGIFTEEFERYFDVLTKEKLKLFTTISHHSKSPPTTYVDELDEFRNHLLGVLELHFKTKTITDMPMMELMDGLSPKEVIEFLRSYEPKEPYFEYLDTTSRKFQDYVQKEPNEFSKLAPQIIDLNPTFISRFFGGIRKAVEQKQNIDWKSVLSLCEEIIESERSGKPQKYRIFHAIAITINVGIDMDSIDFALRNRVWDLLKFLVDLEDTDSFMEEAYPNNNWDSFEISRNTINGITFHSILGYAIWCNNHVTNKVFVPEVKELISDYLDHKIPPSVSRQAVLGYYLVTLYYFDKAWIRSRLDKLLTSTNESLSRSAWDAYLINDVYKNVFIDLAEKYDAHIQKLKDPPLKDDQLWETDRRVIEHVTIAYLFKVDGARKLFDSMILHSHKKVLSHCSWHISIILKQQKAELDEFFDIGAFREIWRNSKLPTSKEIPDWFRHSPLDEEETLELLYNSLEKIDDGTYILFPIEELESYVKTCPKLTVKCLGQIIEKDRSGWGYRDTASKLKDLLRILLDNDESKDDATALIHRLVELGFSEYEDLLK